MHNVLISAKVLKTVLVRWELEGAQPLIKAGWLIVSAALIN